MSDHPDVTDSMGNELVLARGTRVERVDGFAPLEQQVPDRDLLLVVEVVLSTYLGEGRSRRASDVYCLSRTIAACARTEIIRDGAILAAPCPSLREMPWPDGAKGLRTLGLTRPDLSRLWLQAQHEQGTAAVLDRKVLETLVPVEIWSALAALIQEGPGIVVERLERYLLELSMRAVPPSRARQPGATHSKRCLTSFATTLRGVMGVLSDLHRRGAAHPSLQQWGAPPRVKVPRTAAAANTDRSAPARHQLRHTFQTLDSEFKRRLNIGPDDDEAAVIKAMPAQRLVGRSAWRLGRNRALFTLLCMTGARIGAALALTITDFDSEHVDPDGNVGPAVALRPGKTLEADDVRWKPLPTAAGEVIGAHVLLTRRLALETDGPGQQTRRQRTHLPAEYPLFPASIKYLERPWDRSGFYEALAGRVTRPAARQKPWYEPLQRPSSSQAASETNQLGYSPHTLRRAALQMVREGGRDFCAQHNLPFSPEIIASALLDHDIRSDPYGYADQNTLHGRERLARLGAQIAWEMLATDRGARKTINADAYHQATKKRAILTAELARRNTDIAIAVQEARAARKVPADLLLDLLANDERTELQSQLVSVEAEIHALLNDPKTLASVADHITQEDLQRQREALDAAIKHGHTERRRAGSATSHPIRDWISVRELAEVVGISYPTAARWVRGEHLPHPVGDPRNPWKHRQVRVDVSLGERRRRIAVEHINPAYIRTQTQQRRLAELLARWPAGWSETHCKAPLVWEHTLDDHWRLRRSS